MHFSASHFLRFCGDCEKLHGHNYAVDVTMTGPLNEDGMVIDFGEVKDKIVKICKNLDHKVMLPGDSKTISVKLRRDSFKSLWAKRDTSFLKKIVLCLE